MSRTFKDAPGSKQNRSGPSRGQGRQRNISVRAVRRDPPDLRKLSRALIQMAMAEAEAQESTTKPDQEPEDDSSADKERHD